MSIFFVCTFSYSDRESQEDPTTSEMTEETYSPKIYRKGHGRLSELKAEALKKDRRKKQTSSKFVGGAENTAHPRVAAPEQRSEFELVSVTPFPQQTFSFPFGPSLFFSSYLLLPLSSHDGNGSWQWEGGSLC